MISKEALPIFERIASLLERLLPPPTAPVDLQAATAYVWLAAEQRLVPVADLACIDLHLLQDTNNIVPSLLANTQRFARGAAAHNALLWGARGMGKSSFVKAVFKKVAIEYPTKIALVEIHQEDLATLPALLSQLMESPRRFILFCDDLSFDSSKNLYKSLKVILEGSIAGTPQNVIMYATSNRRHLLPEQMCDNERSTAIHPNEAVEETVSLSDRFGLWLGFYTCSEDEYLAMVAHYAQALGFTIDKKTLHREAKSWAMQRGARSGRVAWQYIVDLAGRNDRSIDSLPSSL